MSKKMRMKARDVAFAFRMGAGFPGDVNRTHPAGIEPCKANSSTPPTAFGQPVLVDSTNGVRPFTTGDQSNTVAAGYGVTVRPFPFQQSSASNFGQADFGAAVPPGGAIDVLRAGYIMVQIPAGVVVKKGNPVYVWAVATSGAHIQGGVEGAYSAGNTTQLLNATFNGPADANGNVEICFNV